MPVRAIHLEDDGHNRLILVVSSTHLRTMQSSAAPNLPDLMAEDRKIRLSALIVCLMRILHREMSTKLPQGPC